MIGIFKPAPLWRISCVDIYTQFANKAPNNGAVDLSSLQIS